MNELEQLEQYLPTVTAGTQEAINIAEKAESVMNQLSNWLTAHKQVVAAATGADQNKAA